MSFTDVTLSASTLYMLYNDSHNWINKQMGIKAEERDYFIAGREAHRLIQDHVSGTKPVKTLSHIERVFPIVETEDFDPKTKFEFSPKDGYTVIGWADGLNVEEKQTLEIKTSRSTLWSIGKFKDSMQRKIYSVGFPWSKRAVLITCYSNPLQWSRFKPKIMELPQTDQDKKDALKYIEGGIKILEAGKFDGGLIDGKCRNKWCTFGKNCYFK